MMMMFELSKAEKISITTDNWQSNSSTEYLGITSHYVNENYQLKSQTLCLEYMTESKSAAYLFKCVQQQLKNWKLENKVPEPRFSFKSLYI
jgi:hypothetical protein